jgi:hypothetical protein
MLKFLKICVVPILRGLKLLSEPCFYYLKSTHFFPQCSIAFNRKKRRENQIFFPPLETVFYLLLNVAIFNASVENVSSDFTSAVDPDLHQFGWPRSGSICGMRILIKEHGN